MLYIIRLKEISSRVQVGNNVTYAKRVRDVGTEWALQVKGNNY